MKSKKMIMSGAGFMFLLTIGVFFQNCAEQSFDQKASGITVLPDGQNPPTLVDEQGQPGDSNVNDVVKSTPQCTIQVANGGTDFSPSIVGQACNSNSDANIVASNGWYICQCR